MGQTALNFDSSFDYVQLVKSLYMLTGMATTLFDAHCQYVYSCPSENCEFCQMLRKNGTALTKCRRSDAEAFDICTKTRKVYAYRCHMGLYEAMVPLYDQDTICGYLMLGQVIDEREEYKQESFERAFDDVDKSDELRQAIDKITSISEDKMKAVVQLLEVYSSYISENKLIKNKVNDFARSVAQYIQDHLTSKLTNAELCYVFLCDRKKLAAEFRKTHGMTIIEYANNMRLRRAQALLKSDPNVSIGYVASSVGFADQGYFCKLFKKKYGMLPSEMQRQYKEEFEQTDSLPPPPVKERDKDRVLKNI